MDTRWECGILAGVRAESGELYVQTDARAIKVRGYNRRPKEDRRNQEELAAVDGLPWEPVPGRSGIEVKAQHRDKEDEDVVVKESKVRKRKPRSIYINKGDLSDAKQGGRGGQPRRSRNPQ